MPVRSLALASAALLVCTAACASGRDSERPRARIAPPPPAARVEAWASLGAEAAGRASSACAYYSPEGFYAGDGGAFEPAAHGPCVAPDDAAVHARVADLALLAALRASVGDARGEAAVGAELARLSSAATAGDYVRPALASLASLDAGAGDGASGCDATAARIARGIAALAVRSRAGALAACPADDAVLAPPLTDTLVPASRCGARSGAQLHLAVAHALLLAAGRGVSARTREELTLLHAWVTGEERRGRLRAPEVASRLVRLGAELEVVDRCAETARLLPEGSLADASRARIPGTGVALHVPRDARLAPGAVELGGALEIRVSLSAEPVEALLARAGARAVRLEGPGPARFRLPGPRVGAAGGGVTVLADLGDVRALLVASHFLPVDARLWDRVAELMATVERAEGVPAWDAAELGFVVDAPALDGVSFGPSAIRFAPTGGGGEPAGVAFSAALDRGGVMPSEQPALCDPGAALPGAVRGASRIVAERERTVAGARGCEVAALVPAARGARFEYVAYGFLPDGRAEIRVTSEAGVDDGAARELLARARRFADGFALARPGAD